MNIVVCVKQVPDTWAEKKLDPSDNTLDRGSVEGVLNELDEYAVEEALRLKEDDASGSSTVTALTMGPQDAVDAVKKALQMGADAAIHVTDPALHGSCAVQTAKALAKAIGTVPWDLVVLGSESTDARTSLLPAMLAEILAVPQLTMARKVTVDGSSIQIERLTDYGHDVVDATLPAVVSVVEKINEPRYPSFKGIMAAKKKPLTTLSAADLGVGDDAPTTAVVSFADRPPRAGGTIIKDEGDGGVKLAEFLAAQKLISRGGHG